MKQIVIPLLILSICVNFATVSIIFFSNPIPTASEHRIFPYLSKRIFIDNQNDILISFTNLRTELRTYINSLPYQTGFYFEYLPSGTSIGVNEKNQFIPASLIKVPIVMAVYKKIELGKLHRNDFITMEERYKDPTSGSMWERENGSQIAVKDAIDKTLDESDNTAKNILLSLLNRDEISFVFDSLDLDIGSKTEQESVISPKNYASILRSLYLSSYLNRESSNEILEILSQASDDKKIRAGIPNNVTVSSKYGVSKNPQSDKSVNSDCGIIYVPKRPYLLCVMIESSEETAHTVMQKTAAMTYAFVSKVK